jgi:hypothetical protein
VVVTLRFELCVRLRVRESVCVSRAAARRAPPPASPLDESTSRPSVTRDRRHHVVVETAAQRSTTTARMSEIADRISPPRPWFGSAGEERRRAGVALPVGQTVSRNS